MLAILTSEKHGKFNVTYRNFDSYKEIRDLMYNEVLILLSYVYKAEILCNLEDLFKFYCRM